MTASGNKLENTLKLDYKGRAKSLDRSWLTTRRHAVLVDDPGRLARRVTEEDFAGLRKLVAADDAERAEKIALIESCKFTTAVGQTFEKRTRGGNCCGASFLDRAPRGFSRPIDAVALFPKACLILW
jgi:hypothetical protein